jgi:O-antigen/teichoic acid export membrane protein
LFLFTAFGYLNSTNLIKSQGRTDLNLKLTLISSLIGIILALVLVPNYGIIGLISTILISTIPNIILALWWINKNYKAKINIKASTKIIISSVISAIITYITISQVNTYSWINLIVGALIYFMAYIFTAPIIGAIDKNDIKNLKEMIKTLGPIEPILKLPLLIIEKMLMKLNKK